MISHYNPVAWMHQPLDTIQFDFFIPYVYLAYLNKAWHEMSPVFNPHHYQKGKKFPLDSHVLKEHYTNFLKAAICFLMRCDKIR
jgi:hypothetical protein